MARERGEDTSVFVPAAGIGNLREKAIARGVISEKTARLQTWFNYVDYSFIRYWLFNNIPRTQVQNALWAEEKFRELRQKHDSWGLDGMDVDENGQIAGRSIWSSYHLFFGNATHPFDMDGEIGSMKSHGELRYQLIPEYRTTLFFREDDGNRVVAALSHQTEDFGLEDFPVNEAFAGLRLRIARVKPRSFSRENFASEGVVLGKLGFWDSRMRLGEFGFGRYIANVTFYETEVLPNGGLITPLVGEMVRKAGGVITEDKYPDKAIIRLDPAKVREDFIARAFSQGSIAGRHPMVFSYSAPRLYRSEIPGGGKS